MFYEGELDPYLIIIIQQGYCRYTEFVIIVEIHNMRL
jgi:hypothetical protein